MSKIPNQVVRAINRFQRAVGDYAFIGTVPNDSDEAIAVREDIEYEYLYARFLLKETVLRAIRKANG